MKTVAGVRELKNKLSYYLREGQERPVDHDHGKRKNCRGDLSCARARGWRSLKNWQAAALRGKAQSSSLLVLVGVKGSAHYEKASFVEDFNAFLD